MNIDTKKIISETVQVFNKSECQRKKFLEITSFVDNKDYKELHKNFLTPLPIRIDCDLFCHEIMQFSNSFERWGTEHTHLPRYGLALVNQDGVLKKNDPINGSLYEWNLKNPNSPIIETDCKKPTEVMTMSSLEELQLFQNYWCRSNILYWGPKAEFKPHIDTVIPSPWIRLWGTTTNNIRLRYAENDTLIEHSDVEPGRLYIIDTSVVHDAYCKDNFGYQFFLSLLPNACKMLKKLVNKKY